MRPYLHSARPISRFLRLSPPLPPVPLLSAIVSAGRPLIDLYKVQTGHARKIGKIDEEQCGFGCFDGVIGSELSSWVLLRSQKGSAGE